MIDKLVTRPFRLSDRPGVRLIYGDDEFARPAMNQHYPRYADYLADSMSHYLEFEPESRASLTSYKFQARDGKGRRRDRPEA